MASEVYNKHDRTLPRYNMDVLNHLHRHKTKRKVVDKVEYYTGAARNKFFVNLVKKHPNLAVYTKSQIANHLIAFNRLLGLQIVDNREGVALPEHIGTIFVGSSSPCAEGVTDHKLSGELGIKIKNKNRHSSGYIARTFYTYNTEKYNFINCQLWRFTPDRCMKTALKKEYTKNWKKYIVIPKTRYIQNFIKQYYNTKYIDRKVNIELEDYNEFDI